MPLRAYVGSAAFTAFAAETARILDDLGAVTYRLRIGEDRVLVQRHDGEADYGAEVLATFARFRRSADPQPLPVDVFRTVDMNLVEIGILERVARLHPAVFRSLGLHVGRYEAFVEPSIELLAAELPFYLGWLDLIRPLQAAGLSFCLPAVSMSGGGFAARGLFDLGAGRSVASPAGEGIVTSDLELSDAERLVVITGPNQSGKTAFARAVGQLHHLTAIGVPVPGSEASVPLGGTTATLFARAEDPTDLTGRLESELLRARTILDDLRAGTVVIMNESFASTTVEDALALDRALIGEMRAARGHVLRGDVPQRARRGRPRDRDHDQRHGPDRSHPPDLPAGASSRPIPWRTLGRWRRSMASATTRSGLGSWTGSSDEVRACCSPTATWTSVRLPPRTRTLVADLGLDRLYEAMSRGDRSLDEIVRRVVPSPLDTVEAIRYRQATVADALASPDVVRELYAIAVDAIEGERKVWGGKMRNAELRLDRAAEVIGLFLASFRPMRRIQAEHATAFTSPAFTAFFELHRDAARRRLARRGGRPRGSASDENAPCQCESGARQSRHRVRPASTTERHRGLAWSPGARGAPVDGRGHAQGPALDEHDRGASCAGDRPDRRGGRTRPPRWVLEYFKVLRTELGFLVGCLNLHDALGGDAARVCLPDPIATADPAFSATGLYDPGLRLTIDGPVVGNDAVADGARVVVITGANGGGKSTFLRAMGLAQVMLQAGMFVAADSFAASLRSNVLTHFTRAEDLAMERGKLDEELARLGDVIDRCSPTSLVLLNESLSSTNEREGAEIAQTGRHGPCRHRRQRLVRDPQPPVRGRSPAIRRRRFASCAPMRADGSDRSFHITEAAPESTSHGMDLYDKIVGAARSEPLAGSAPD